MYPYLSSQHHLTRNARRVVNETHQLNQSHDVELPIRSSRIRTISRRNGLITNLIQNPASSASVARERSGSLHAGEVSRQGRVSSLPSERDVDQRRLEERNEGGPPPPRNSVALDDDVPNMTDDYLPEVFRNMMEASTEEYDSSEDDSIEIVPPPSVSSILRNRLNVLRDSLVLHRAVQESLRASLNITVDLTQSPARSSFGTCPYPTSPVPDESSPTSPSTPSSSLKCPVCLEAFCIIHKRGSRLVSTVCGHVFCGKCLPACVRTTGKCPTCRRPLGYQDFHLLYLY